MPPNGGGTDLTGIFQEYINECRFSECLRVETIRGYENVFRLFKKIMPEVTTVESLNAGMLNEFFKRICTRPRIVGKGEIRTGVKNSTIKTHYNKLNAFFLWLFRKDYIEKNPLADIKRPRVRYDDFRRLTDSEINKIYSAIVLHSSNSFTQRRNTAMVSLLVYCGLRKGELVSLQVKDIDVEKRTIVVRAETSKSKRERTLKMHPTLVLHLKDYLKERNIRGMRTEHLLASNRGDAGLSYEGLKHWVQDLNYKSGVKFHLHQLRHTFGCKLAEADVNLSKISKMMGHVDVRMTAKYLRSLKTEDMEEDIGKISI